jgi:PTH1 family peptidyl-tRNA hydrolase
MVISPSAPSLHKENETFGGAVLEDLTIIAGLGNPGKKYDNTRHNVGFIAIDILSAKYGIKVNRLKHKALIGDGIIKGKRVLLVKPQTFMNLSGESIYEIVEWYKLPLEKLIVIYDDADLPAGSLRIRPKGSSGTHNGMKSIIYQLQSDEFPRIRIGIGKAPEGWDLADYVLSKISADDGKAIGQSIEKATDAAAAIVDLGIEAAMNLYNGDQKGSGE